MIFILQSNLFFYNTMFGRSFRSSSLLISFLWWKYFCWHQQQKSYKRKWFLNTREQKKRKFFFFFVFFFSSLLEMYMSIMVRVIWFILQSLLRYNILFFRFCCIITSFLSMVCRQTKWTKGIEKTDLLC